MESPVKQRLIEFIVSQGLSKNFFEKRCGLGKGFVNNIVNSIQPRTLARITQQFPELNTAWLLTGEGDMLRGGLSETLASSPAKLSNVYDIVSIQGGIASGTGIERILTTDEPIGRLYAPNLPADREVFYTVVKGDSMLNRKDPARSIPDGAYIGLRPFTSSSIQWGEVYAIMTTDGPIVKKVLPSEKEGYIKCVSFNVEDGFFPFDLNTSEIIYPMFKVVGVFFAVRWV